ATEAAQQALTVQDQLGLTRKWNAAQELQRDAETNRLLSEANAAGTDPNLVTLDGRKVALRLLTTGGPWTKSAAEGALSGADREVQEFVHSGVARAASLDDRETLQEIVDDANPAKKAAGQQALAGSDADVKRFLASPDYPTEGSVLRLQVNQVQATARAESNAIVVSEAQKALDTGTVTAYRQFLDTGQNVAREKDDRLALNQLIANTATGPEARMLAQAALAGPPDMVRMYRLNGQYVAARHDRESAAHNSVVAGLVAEATSVAATASQNAALAQSVAADARHDATKAHQYAEEAGAHATDAFNSAKDAAKSAQDARESAEKAYQSAVTAQDAAARASQAAVRASQSAMAARHSANLAARYAASAVTAAHQAYQDAIDAGKDADAAVAAANDARDKAIAKANAEIDAANKKFADDVNGACNSVPAGPEHDDCVARATRLINDPKGESERNVAVCNQLKQYSEQTFNDCLKGAYNPALTYLINKAISDAKQKAGDEADSERWWSIAGTIVAGAVIVGAGVFCAEICTAPLVGALAGAEAGFLAEAAGAGIELTIGAEFVTGIASDSFLASRLSALSTEEFLSGIAVRNGLADIAKNIAKQIAGICTPGFAAAATEPCFKLVGIQYKRWGDELGDIAYRFREARNLLGSPGINIGVGKMPGWPDEGFGPGYIVARSNGAKELHSEEIIIQKIRDAGLDPKKLEALFTERSPCLDKCSPLLNEALSPGTEVSFGVFYLGNSRMETEMLDKLLEIRAAGGE
ncbi:MAG: hypothetical protein QOI78_1041, partial [Actinomycetota bacterium]|nr:hypothetical protein [Actinomycetota bacterium]